MPFNLITDPWLPVRRLSGKSETVRPGDIADSFNDDPILALDFPRPDWNAAVTEFLIGLLATVMPPADTSAWADLWATPPMPDELNEKLAHIAFAFNLDGESPRCFQDFDQPDVSWAQRPIEWLVLAGPVENTVKLNTDLFSKRDQIATLCVPYCAAALITQQTYAPEGGPGFRTSVRGGGPLTTLARVRRKLPDNLCDATLWDLVWANTPDNAWSDAHELSNLTGNDSVWSTVFPWLGPTRTSENDKPTTLDHIHKLQAFFGLPCRIRLNFEASDTLKLCSLNGPITFGSLATWWTKKHGVKYEGVTHPLSPYNVNGNRPKTAGHHRPGVGTYRDWLKWAEDPDRKTAERAACIEAWGKRLGRIKAYSAYDDSAEFRTADIWQSSILAWGYDFKQNKARAWLNARIPFFDPPPNIDPDQWSEQFLKRARNLVDGADKAAAALRFRSRLACFGARDKENGSYSLPKNSGGKDAFEDLIERYWRATERAFRDALAGLRNNPDDEGKSIRGEFLTSLRKTALTFFDEIAGTDDLMESDAHRIVVARSNLQFSFASTGEVSRALDISVQQSKTPKKQGTKKDAA